MHHCPGCATRERSLFCSLAGGHLKQLDKEKVTHVYRAGQVIFHEGTAAHAVHCVYSGLVRLYKTDVNGREVTIRLLREGEILGYRPVLAGEVFAATAEAVEESTLCTISRETILKMLQEDPDLSFAMMAKLARELRVSEDEMVLRLHETVTQRTVRFLLWLAEGLGTKGTPSLKLRLPVRREDIAQMIGTTPETLSRTLRSLSEKGLLRVDRRNLEIRQLQSLKNLINSTRT